MTAFTAMTNVSLMLCNRWNSCLNYVREIRFRISYIFRDGNAFANKLASLDFIHIEYFYWYNKLSSILFLEFFIYRYRLLMYI